MQNLQPLGLLAGRVMLALIFILAGLGKIMSYFGTAAYMASKGIPMAEYLLVPTIIVELGGGLLLAVGYKARWAALALFLFIIPTTLIFHAFWAASPEQAQMQMIQFEKNIAIMGGMLYVFIIGPGPLSVDLA